MLLRGLHKRWIAGVLALGLLLGLMPAAQAQAVVEVDAEQKTVYANGLPLLILGTQEGGTLLKVDSDLNGADSAGDLPVELQGLAGDAVAGYDLSAYTLFGGSCRADVDSAALTMLGGSVGNLYGGGLGFAVKGSTSVKLQGGSVAGNVFGGGVQGAVAETASVAITGGEVGAVGAQRSSTIAAGGLGEGASVGAGSLRVGGEAVLVATLYGGGSLTEGTATGSSTVTLEGGATLRGDVFGGGNQSPVTGAAQVVLKESAVVYGNLYGGGHQADCGSTSVQIAGAPAEGLTVTGRVAGGGLSGAVGGAVQLQLTGGARVGDVVGGCVEGAVAGTIEVVLDNATTGPVIGGCVAPVGQPQVLAQEIRLRLSEAKVIGDLIGGCKGAHQSGSLRMELESSGVTGGLVAGPSGTADTPLQLTSVLLQLTDAEVGGGVGLGGNAQLSEDATLLFWSGSARRAELPAKGAAAGSLLYVDSAVELAEQTPTPRDSFAVSGAVTLRLNLGLLGYRSLLVHPLGSLTVPEGVTFKQQGGSIANSGTLLAGCEGALEVEPSVEFISLWKSGDTIDLRAQKQPAGDLEAKGWAFVPQTGGGTLTLRNLSLAVGAGEVNGILLPEGSIRLVLEGESSVAALHPMVQEGDSTLTLSGSGSLQLRCIGGGTVALRAAGLALEGGGLTLAAEQPLALSGGLLLAGGALTAQGTSGPACGGDVTLTGGTLTASGPLTAAHYSQSGGTAVLTAGMAAASAEISGGSLAAEAKETAIGVAGALAVKSGTVTATAGEGGVAVDAGSYSQSGGSLTATAGDIALRAKSAALLSGGSLTLTGGSAGLSLTDGALELKGGSLTATASAGAAVRALSGQSGGALISIASSLKCTTQPADGAPRLLTAGEGRASAIGAADLRYNAAADRFEGASSRVEVKASGGANPGGQTPGGQSPGGGGGGGAVVPVSAAPAVEVGLGGSVAFEADNTRLVITPQEGYEIAEILVNGKAVAIATVLEGLKPGDSVKVTFVKSKAAPEAPAPSFTDTQGHWAGEAIAFCVGRGLFAGVSDTHFAPDALMTRGMFVTVLHRLAGSPAAGEADMADVPPGAWFAPGVGWATSSGIVRGVGEGCFAPDGSVTREQIAAMLYAYAGRPSTSGEAALHSGYGDAHALSPWAQQAMCWAVETGLIQGRDGGLLAPTGTATRAEVATLLMRYCTMTEPAQQS